MTADICEACKPGATCPAHQAASDTAAILATVSRETRPYNAPGGVGSPAPASGPHESPRLPRRGITGRLSHLMSLDNPEAHR